MINKEYITREEAASLLNITLPTLHRYAKMDRIRIYKFGSRSLLKTEELILAIKENKIIKYGVTSLHLYCKDIFVPLRRTLRIQYLMWLYKCTSCPCIRAGFAFIAPEPISSANKNPVKTRKNRNRSTSIAVSLWCHQGLMYPCKHLYLNALPLAYIKKPRDWHV